MELIIKKSLVHGRGVFTKETLRAGTILECPVIPCPYSVYMNTFLFDGQNEYRHCLHIGFGTFLNSSVEPNLKHIEIDNEKQISYFEVIKDIEKGEEVLLKYL